MVSFFFAQITNNPLKFSTKKPSYFTQLMLWGGDKKRSIQMSDAVNNQESYCNRLRRRMNGCSWQVRQQKTKEKMKTETDNQRHTKQSKGPLKGPLLRPPGPINPPSRRSRCQQ
jgi:hypothetical protein